MTFQQKIDKILVIKRVALWKLAELGGTKKSTLEKAYDRNGEMRQAAMDNFLQKLCINQEWWETGKGDIFLPDGPEPEQADRQSAKEAFNKRVASGLERELLDQLYKDLDNQARHLDKALDLVAQMLPLTQGVKGFTTKDR